MSEAASFIPAEVEAAYFPRGIEGTRRLGAGMINVTVMVEPVESEVAVVQQLSPIFNEDLMTDYDVVADHLKAGGWEMPGLVKTTEGGLYQKDNHGKVWRAFEYVESDGEEFSGEETVPLTEYGTLLGKLHRSLATLDYEPIFTLPHFHDTTHYADLLTEVHAEIPTDQGQAFASLLLESYKQLPELPDYGKQLIHGDPRVANILHRDGQPFTFIDWDTLMKGTVWMDVGDMLRSLGEESLMKGEVIDVSELSDMVEAYRREAFPDADPVQFGKDALSAGQTIALELAMRFAADFQDGDAGYFGWDEAAYPNRHAHNIERAAKQYGIYEGFQQYLEGPGFGNDSV